MTIYDLINIIRGHGRRDKWGYYIGGCELLEHVSNVPVFVSLLREFKRDSDVEMVSFVEDYPEPVSDILGGGVAFVSYSESYNVIQVVGVDEEYRWGEYRWGGDC